MGDRVASVAGVAVTSAAEFSRLVRQQQAPVVSPASVTGCSQVTSPVVSCADSRTAAGALQAVSKVRLHFVKSAILLKVQ